MLARDSEENLYAAHTTRKTSQQRLNMLITELRIYHQQDVDCLPTTTANRTATEPITLIQLQRGKRRAIGI